MKIVSRLPLVDPPGGNGKYTFVEVSPGRVAALENVTVHRRTELTALEGGERLERVHFRGAGGIEGTMTAHHLFVFVGAEPNTSWLKTCGVSLDEKGFVLTDIDLAEARTRPLLFQTSVESVFAIGDVRSGSIKRVAAAVGEGAQVVATLHGFLSTAGLVAPPATAEAAPAKATAASPPR